MISTLATFIQLSISGSSQSNWSKRKGGRKRKERKERKTKKKYLNWKEVKMSLILDGMILPIKNLDPLEKLLELINLVSLLDTKSIHRNLLCFC